MHSAATPCQALEGTDGPVTLGLQTWGRHRCWRNGRGRRCGNPVSRERQAGRWPGTAESRAPWDVCCCAVHGVPGWVCGVWEPKAAGLLVLGFPQHGALQRRRESPMSAPQMMLVPGTPLQITSPLLGRSVTPKNWGWNRGWRREAHDPQQLRRHIPGMHAEPAPARGPALPVCARQMVEFRSRNSSQCPGWPSPLHPPSGSHLTDTLGGDC